MVHGPVTDWNIVMRYTPDNMLKEDGFNLVTTYKPMDDPKEIVVTLKIQPKIFIFSCK